MITIMMFSLPQCMSEAWSIFPNLHWKRFFSNEACHKPANHHLKLRRSICPTQKLTNRILCMKLYNLQIKRSLHQPSTFRNTLGTSEHFSANLSANLSGNACLYVPPESHIACLWYNSIRPGLTKPNMLRIYIFIVYLHKCMAMKYPWISSLWSPVPASDYKPNWIYYFEQTNSLIVMTHTGHNASFIICPLCLLYFFDISSKQAK